MLEFEKKEVMVVDYDDFDRFMTEHFGVESECVADNEWSNDECHLYSIKEKDVSDDPESFFQKYTVKEVEAWVAGTKKYGGISASSLLEYLAWKKVLPFGEYLIEVSW